MSNLTIALERKDDTTSTVKVYVTGLSPVMVGGKLKYQRLRFNAGVITTKDWDHRVGRPSAAFSRRDGGTLQRSIDLTCLNVQRAYLEVAVKTAKAVRERYDELQGKKRQVESKSTMLTDLVDGWIAKGGVSDHTRHTYIGFGRKVREYERSIGSRIDLSRASTVELEELLHWIRRAFKLASNSMASHQKFLNKALNEVRNSGVTGLSKNIKLFGFSTPKKDILDWADLSKIVSYQPQSRTEANAQTLLVAICLSSVRISDVWLHLSTIEKRGVLCSDFIVTKNSGRHPVSVSPIVFEPVRLLIDRNGLPPHVSEIHIRRSIKALVSAVGINKNIEVHSLRRSFVSLFLSLGLIPDFLLARVFTGHRMMGEKSIFHAYNHSSMTTAQRTIIELLRRVDPKLTGGLELLSNEVCTTL